MAVALGEQDLELGGSWFEWLVAGNSVLANCCWRSCLVILEVGDLDHVGELAWQQGFVRGLQRLERLLPR